MGLTIYSSLNLLLLPFLVTAAGFPRTETRIMNTGFPCLFLPCVLEGKALLEEDLGFMKRNVEAIEKNSMANSMAEIKPENHS